MSCPPAKNASDLPSGDQNGKLAPLVPVMLLLPRESSERMVSASVPLVFETIATFRASDDMAMLRPEAFQLLPSSATSVASVATRSEADVMLPLRGTM